MAPIITRGFRGRRAADVDPARIPPGQYVTTDFPVLSAGPTPRTALELWDFSIVGELAEPRRWTWEQFQALPSEEITRDIHCVTKWSKLNTVWRGVSLDTLLAAIDTSAEYRSSMLIEAACSASPPIATAGALSSSTSPTPTSSSRAS
jgi:DMSO/TMAO reductase YedYZ molybdopterin-dependent catalytic subunit